MTLCPRPRGLHAERAELATWAGQEGPPGAVPCGGVQQAPGGGLGTSLRHQQGALTPEARVSPQQRLGARAFTAATGNPREPRLRDSLTLVHSRVRQGGGGEGGPGRLQPLQAPPSPLALTVKLPRHARLHSEAFSNFCFSTPRKYLNLTAQAKSQDRENTRRDRQFCPT